MADPIDPKAQMPVNFNEAIPTQRRIQPPKLMVEALKEAAVLGNDNPRMPEHAFRAFLAELYNPATDHFDQQLWRETIGDVRHGLNVTDEAGNLLFICPPPVGTTVTTIPAPGMNGFSRVVRESRDMENRTAALGQKTLNEGLNREAPGIRVFDIRAAWRAVLERYGVVPKASDPSSPAGQSAQSYYMDDVEEP